MTKNRPLLAILAVALISRVAVAVYLGDTNQAWPLHDQNTYDTLAQRFLAGKGFSFAEGWYPWIPPDTQTSYFSGAMVLYLSAIYAVVGYHPVAARIVTAVIGAASCYLVYRLGRKMFGEQVGLLSAGLMAVYAYLVYYSATLMTETPFIAAVLLSLNVAVDVKERSTWGRWAWLGAFLALAVLFRQSALLFAVVLVGWVYLTSRQRPPLLLATVPFLIIALGLAPFTARNYSLFGRFLLSESQFGHVFWVGNHPDRDVTYDFEDTAWVAPLPDDIAEVNEAEKTYVLMQRGLQNVLDDPARFVELSLHRAKTMFTFWPTSSSSTTSNVARVMSFGLLFPFAVYGLVLSLRDWRRFFILYGFIITHSGVYVASWMMIRYRVPVDPLLIMFGAYGMVHIWSKAPLILRERAAVAASEVTRLAR